MIVNPHSGRKKPTVTVGKIADMFSAHHMEVVAYFTSPEYNADYHVKEHYLNYDIISCFGGDGTISELITGVMQAGIKKPLGLIPNGTTNDLARSLGLAAKPDKAVRVISSGVPRPFDIGSFNNDFFVYIASFGAFTNVSYETPQRAKNIFGRTAYFFSAAKYLNTIKSHHIKIITDDRSCEGDYIFGSVSNSRSVAGLFHFDNDQVDFADGKFEVLLVKRPKNVFDLFSTFFSMLGKSYKHENIILFHASDIKIICDEALDWAVDGEHRNDGKTIHIVNYPKAVNIIAKKKSTDNAGSKKNKENNTNTNEK